MPQHEEGREEERVCTGGRKRKMESAPQPHLLEGAPARCGCNGTQGGGLHCKEDGHRIE